MVLSVLVVVVLVALHQPATRAQDASPWDFIPERGEPVDHSTIFTDPFDDPHAVTEACLMCHPDVAEHFMQTSHWTWVSDEIVLPGGTEPEPFGKINSINNFCVSVPSNWPRCTSCHPGYGWEDASFDFSDPLNIDCLVCHDTTGTYKKEPTGAGYPAEGVDLLAVAQSVGKTDRLSCGTCHFNGGGGDAVKHGDMDMTMVAPSARIDAHMGKHDLTCTDCHQTVNHEISGRLPWLNSDEADAVTCEQCHGNAPHAMPKLNDHCDTVSCQACHAPAFAIDTPTKMKWDWRTAGLSEAPDERVWVKKKGSFEFAQNVTPEYYWWNGEMDNCLPGEEINPATETALNEPLGSMDDPEAKIWPFKVHRGWQPYDKFHRHLLVPKLFGKGGFWKTWDWDQSFRLGAEASGVEFSGSYDFAPTAMYWPITHMVQVKDAAVGCMDCHGGGTRLDWEALGYDGDPMQTGARN
jgi:octaheme c-type cytochrome (tetrathionate reductase family)